MLKVELLDAAHDRSNFDCGAEALNRYLRQTARQHMTKGVAKTFVLVDDEMPAPKAVLGFFSISLCEVQVQQVPADLARGLPDKLPAMRLGRLAIASARQGGGYGKLLLAEVLDRAIQVEGLVGGIGIFVDAKDERAAAFYRRFGFVPAPAGRLTLFMPFKTIRTLTSGR